MSEENETAEAPEVVEKAAAMGHMNKDEWTAKGKDPDKWRSPAEFVKHGEDLNPILKERLDHSVREMAEMKQTMQQMHSHFMKAEEVAERRGWEKAIAEVTKKQVAAVEIADVDEFNKLEKEKFDLLRQPPMPAEQHGPEPDFVEFNAKNEWYGQDRKMTVFADAIGRAYREENPRARLKEVFKEVEAEVKSRFPEKFSNPRREGASAVEGGTAPVKRGGKTFDDLPREAKDAYARFAKQIPGFKKEEYLKNYDWS
jgi:hypothetical protein